MYRSKKVGCKSEEDNLEKDKIDTTELKIKHHYYDAKTIQQLLKLLMLCSISLREIEKIFELLSEDKSKATPSCTGIRKWLERVGVYELKRDHQPRD
jgi:flagellar biosynthesis component FlhA